MLSSAIERESLLTVGQNPSDEPITNSYLGDLEKAVVEDEEAEREGGHHFEGNLYLFFALKCISTPAKALRHTNDIHQFLRGHYDNESREDASLDLRTAALNTKRTGVMNAQRQKRAFHKVLQSMKIRNPFARVLQNLLRMLTPMLQIVAPLCIILRAYEKVHGIKLDWIAKCGHIPEFCTFMQTYRFNFLFNPDVAELSHAKCTMGDAGLFKMNKFFMFNPYEDEALWAWMSKILCVAFLFAVGVRVSVDFDVDFHKRQQATLVARHFLRNVEQQLPGRRTFWTPYQTTRLWIWVGGLVRIASALFMLTAMALCLWGTKVPRDVVMDALGLVFIYNLDAAGSEFGMLSTQDWDPVWMGRLYSMVIEPKIAEEIATLKLHVIDTYRSETEVLELEKNDGDDDLDDGQLSSRGSEGRSGFSPLDLKDVMFRNMAEERVLFNVSSYATAKHWLVQCGRRLYLLYLVLLLIFFLIGAAPHFHPYQTDIVVKDHLIYKCLVKDGVPFYSK